MPLKQDISELKVTVVDRDKTLADLEQILKAAEKVSGVQININNGGLKGLIDSQNQLTKASQEGEKALQSYNKTQLANEKAAQAAIKTQIEAEKLRQQEIKTLKAVEEQQKKAAAAASANKPVPFTSNVNANGTLQQAASGGTPANPSAPVSTGTFTNLNNQTTALKNSQTQIKLTKAEQDRLNEANRLAALDNAKHKLAVQEATAALKLEAKEGIAAKGSLDQRSAALSRLQKSYAALSASERDSGYGQRLQKTIQQVNTQVSALEQSTGKFNRNVGNYPKTFDVASSSIDKLGKAAGKAFGFLKTAANIIPGLGISGIFLLGFEAIMKVVDGLDLFGKKAGKVSEGMQKIKDDSIEFEKSLNGVKSSSAVTGIQLQNFVDIAKDGKVPLEQRNYALREANKILGEHGEKLTIANINTAAATEEVKKYTNALVAQALAGAYANRIADLIAKRADVSDARNKQLAEQAKIEAELRGVQGNSARDLVTQYNDLIKKRQDVNENTKQYNALTDDIVNITKRLTEEQKKSVGLFGDLGIHTKKDAKDKRDYADVINELTESLRILGEQLASQFIDDNAFDTGKIKAYETAVNELFKLGASEDTPLVQQILEKIDPLRVEQNLKDTIKRLYELSQGAQEAIEDFKNLSKVPPIEIKTKLEVPTTEEAYSKALEAQQTFDAIANAKSQLSLVQRYAAGKITREKYEQDLLDLQDKYGKESLQKQINSLRAQEKFAYDGVEQTEEVLKKRRDINAKILALEVELGKNINDSDDKTNAKRLEKLSDFFSQLQSKVAEVSDIIGSVIDIGITKQKNALQEIEDIRQETYEREVERINTSTLNQTQQSEQLRILEAKRQAEKQKFDRDNREADLKKARFDKAANIASIITGGILAVINTLKDPKLIASGTAIPLALAVGALSAAKLAVAIATPLPKYRNELRHDKPDHFGIYGEDGTEVVTRPGHEPEIASSATVGWLPKGSRVMQISKMNQDEINGILYRGMAKQTAAMAQKDSVDPSIYVLQNIEQGINRMVRKRTGNTINVNIKDEFGHRKYKYYNR